MNEKNIKFLRDRIGKDYEIETFLGTVILKDEELLAIHCIQKDFKNSRGASGFNDNVLLLTDKRIIKLNIDSSLITFESYSFKVINGFKITKKYNVPKEDIRSTDWIEEIIILLKDKINDKYYLKIEFDNENKKLRLESQKRNAFEFVKELSKLI